MELRRLSDIIPRIEEESLRRRWQVLTRKGVTLQVQADDERFILDVREHTGPVLWPALEAWIDQLRCRGTPVLLAMGFFPKTALSKLLERPKRARRLVLVEMGLHDFFDTAFRPRRLGPTPPFAAMVEEVLTERGLSLQPIPCDYCFERPLASCQVCGALLCKSHFIRCPLCNIRFCHPDVNDCYFKHHC